MTDTPSAPLTAAELKELETYLRDTSPFGYYRRITMAFALAREALRLREAAENALPMFREAIDIAAEDWPDADWTVGFAAYDALAEALAATEEAA